MLVEARRERNGRMEGCPAPDCRASLPRWLAMTVARALMLKLTADRERHPGYALGMPDLPDLSKLTAALPSSVLSFDGGEMYAVDGMTPSVVVKPTSQAEVAAAMGAANAAGAAVVPFGGGTQQGLGMPPERYDVALDLRQIESVVEYEAADLTITVEAGMRLSALQRLLAEKGQWLPLDPPVSDEATIGGVLATNASGPARFSRGTGRDLVIGMTVATAQGEIVKSGGRVVKNVAGYDLAKLHIGALGTTGVILQVSLKVSPLPVRTSMVAIRGEPRSADRAVERRGGAPVVAAGCRVGEERPRRRSGRWRCGSRQALRRSSDRWARRRRWQTRHR